MFKPKKYTKLIALALLLTFSLVFLAGCKPVQEPGGEGKEDSKYGGTAVFRIHSEVDYMNPFEGGIYSLYGIAETSGTKRR